MNTQLRAMKAVVAGAVGANCGEAVLVLVCGVGWVWVWQRLAGRWAGVCRCLATMDVECFLSPPWPLTGMKAPGWRRLARGWACVWWRLAGKCLPVCRRVVCRTPVPSLAPNEHDLVPCTASGRPSSAGGRRMAAGPGGCPEYTNRPLGTGRPRARPCFVHRPSWAVVPDTKDVGRPRFVGSVN